MAGIGFELKKVLKKTGVISIKKGFLFTAVIPVVPFMTAMVTLVLVQLFFKTSNQPYYLRQLFLIITVYSFIFSQIFTSGFCMVITRFIADRVYEKAYEDIVPSLYGILVIVLLSGSIYAINDHVAFTGLSLGIARLYEYSIFFPSWFQHSSNL
jgi:uncharacterized membrane protein